MFLNSVSPSQKASAKRTTRSASTTKNDVKETPTAVNNVRKPKEGPKLYVIFKFTIILGMPGVKLSFCLVLTQLIV